MRKVLITGATSGFGKLLAEAFLNNGDMVIATGRNLSARKEIFAAEREKFPGKLLELTMDVTNLSEIRAAFSELDRKVGAIDVLINNAGYGLFGALEDLKDEEIRYQMEVNFFGTVNVTKFFLPMLRQTHGKIFNFSSVFGFMGFPLTSLYCASKYAVEGLTESLRGELAPHGVQVCLIEPGGYRTNFGNSLAWSGPSDAYKTQLENYKALRNRLAGRKNPQNPAEVKVRGNNQCSNVRFLFFEEFKSIGKCFLNEERGVGQKLLVLHDLIQKIRVIINQKKFTEESRHSYPLWITYRLFQLFISETLMTGISFMS